MVEIIDMVLYHVCTWHFKLANLIEADMDQAIIKLTPTKMSGKSCPQQKRCIKLPCVGALFNVLSVIAHAISTGYDDHDEHWQYTVSKKTFIP